jgi:hypothetical protein
MKTIKRDKSLNQQNNEAINKLEQLLDNSYKSNIPPIDTNTTSEIDNLHYMNARLLSLIERLIRRIS